MRRRDSPPPRAIDKPEEAPPPPRGRREGGNKERREVHGKFHGYLRARSRPIYGNDPKTGVQVFPANLTAACFRKKGKNRTGLSCASRSHRYLARPISFTPYVPTVRL
jgi:hypothetical protein